MPYTYPVEDARFIFENLLDFDTLCADLKLDDIDSEMALTIIAEAARLGEEVFAPLNRSGDVQHARWQDGVVHEPDGFKEAYTQLAEGGWLSLVADEEYGGQALPQVIATAIGEIWNAANMSLALCPLLCEGAIEAISHHADEELRARFLPKMISGTWTGTMNLTEPHAGTDLAAITTQAKPQDGAYAITGQKIFITWGEHQMTENIVHLVLARLPDAPDGIKGISLFIVPKINVDEGGELTMANNITCLSIEDKLGVRGSPTCVMQYDGATGYLVGEAHKGISYMFTMMNRARQAVAMQGVSISSRAYQQAVEFSKTRIQGRNAKGKGQTIINYPDVRRMLMQMRALTEASRALILEAAICSDRAKIYGDDHVRRDGLLTPIAKGFITEIAQEVTSLNVQIHGGMGFIEETGAAQHYRDARILPIYEGTTGIQALDLVGRKILLDKGAALDEVITEIAKRCNSEHAPQRDEILALISNAKDELFAKNEENPNNGPAISVHVLMCLGYALAGWAMLRSKIAAERALENSDANTSWLNTKITTTQFYFEQILPRAKAHLDAMRNASDTILAMSEEDF